MTDNIDPKLAMVAALDFAEGDMTDPGELERAAFRLLFPNHGFSATHDIQTAPRVILALPVHGDPDVLGIEVFSPQANRTVRLTRYCQPREEAQS